MCASHPPPSPEKPECPVTDDRPTTAQLLDLEAHPEGGWFRRMWTGTYAVDAPAGARPAATLIHYLLTP
ncbi:cupin domain-containing protein, partial [Staphylococcus aureus]